ncbi:MAG: O-antigen ligase family protein, partial [Fimbriimonadaceae bacterium]|nr:O-antigen ligase family protein [Fimbriimonadaceae bacterium]
MTRDLSSSYGWIGVLAAGVVAIMAGGFIPTDPSLLPESSFFAIFFGPGELPQMTRAIVAILVLVPYALLLLTNRVITIPSVRLIGTVGLFGLVLLGSTVSSPYRFPALVSFVQWMVPLAGLVATVGLVGRGKRPTYILGALVAAIVVVAMRGILEYGEMRALDSSWRIFAGYQNPNAVAGVLAAGIPLALGLAQSLERPINLLCGAASIPMVVALALTQSRGGFLALAVALIVGIVLLFSWREGKKSALWLLPILVAGTFMFSLSQRSDVNSGAVANRIGDVQSTAEQSSGFRINLWKSAIALAREEPLGNGLGSFRYESGKPGLVTQTVHAHQSFLQLAAEAGVIALILFVIIAVLWLMDVLRGARELGAERKVRLVAIVSAVAALAAQGMTESNVASLGPLWLMVTLMALGLCVSADGLAPEQAPASFRVGTAVAVAFLPLVLALLLGQSEMTRNGLYTQLMSRPTPSLAAQFESVGRGTLDGDMLYYAGRISPPGESQVALLRDSVRLLPSTRNLRALANAQRINPEVAEESRQGAATSTLVKALSLDPYNLTTLHDILEVALESRVRDEIVRAAQNLIAVEQTASYNTRSLPEFIPTETADARVALAEWSGSRDEK